jgi:hypothetical protein
LALNGSAFDFFELSFYAVAHEQIACVIVEFLQHSINGIFVPKSHGDGVLSFEIGADCIWELFLGTCHPNVALGLELVDFAIEKD